MRHWVSTRFVKRIMCTQVHAVMPSSAPPPAKDGWAPQPDFSMTASQLARDLSLGTTKVQPGQGRWAVGYVTPPEYVSRASVRRGATMWPWRNHGHGHCPTGQVAGGVTSLEPSSAARAADGNGNNRKCGGGWPSQPPSTPSGFLTPKCH